MSAILHQNDNEENWEEVKPRKNNKKKSPEPVKAIIEPVESIDEKTPIVPVNTLPSNYLAWFESMKVGCYNDPLYYIYNASLNCNYYNSLYLEKMKEEINTPIMLRFKNDSQKRNELCNYIFNFIKSTMVISEDLNPSEITTNIVNSYNSIPECYNMMMNKEELIKVVKNFCTVKKPVQVKPEQVKPEQVKPISVKTPQVKTEENKTSTLKNKNNSDYIEKKNKLLLEAQDDFFELCIPTPEKIKSVKDLLDLNPKKAIVANTISLEQDSIKKGDFSFSKKHYLGNAFFTNMVIKKYVEIFGDSYWVKLIPNFKDGGKLIVMLDINYKKKQEE